MSQTNVEIVRRSILGYNDRGVDVLVEKIAHDAEFHPPKESMEPGVYRGPEVDVIDVDDTRVIAVVKAFGSTPHFAGEVEMNWAWLIAVRDGMMTHTVTFTDRAQALEAAGLSE